NHVLSYKISWMAGDISRWKTTGKMQTHMLSFEMKLVLRVISWVAERKQRR
ncbi:unnamed protein product, partial [Urochloa humidicola]